MTTSQKCPVWLDCDPGVDDAYALILAAHSNEFQLIGVSSVVGNASLQTTTNNALKMLWAIGRKEVPLAKGADTWLIRKATDQAFWDERDAPDWCTGFDCDAAINAAFLSERLAPVDDNAIQFMYQRIKAQLPQRVSIVATGPLTNVALLLKSFPDVRSAVERVVFMGGSMQAGNVNPAAEANVWCDPEACEIVLRSHLPVTMIPLDLTHQVLLLFSLLSSPILSSPFFSCLLLSSPAGLRSLRPLISSSRVALPSALSY